MNDLLLEVKAMQQNLSTQIDNRNNAENSQQRAERVQEEDMEEEEEDTEEEEDEDEEDEEEEDEPESPVMKRRTRPVAAKTSPTPPIGSSISGFSFSNGGSGQIHNQNVGNVVNTTYSNVGNNHSKNYVYGQFSAFATGLRAKVY